MTQKKILVPIGPHNIDLGAVQHALALASRIPARVFVLEFEPAEGRGYSRVEPENIVSDIVAAAWQAGLSVSYHRSRGPFEEEVAGFIRERAIHILVLGEDVAHLDQLVLRSDVANPIQIILVRHRDGEDPPEEKGRQTHCKEAVEAGCAVRQSRKKQGGTNMTKPLEILVLDDEPTVGERLKPVLEGEGHRVEVFVDPGKALKRLDNKVFDIVMTDVRMEKIDGIQVLEHVRARSERTKVLIFTGYASVELARNALSKGVFDFIAKPFKLQDIREMVRKAAEALEAEG